MIERLQAAGWIGNTLLSIIGLVALVGLLTLLVGYIDTVWWLVAVRVFGAPMLDIPASLGVLLGLLPFISVAILSVRTSDGK